MSKALETKIDELFQATKDLRNLEEIKPHCEVFNTWINQQTYSQKSLGTLFSRYGLYSKFHSIPLQQGENAESVPKYDGEGNVTGSRLVHYVPFLCGLNNKDWAERNTSSRSIDRVSAGQPLDPDKYLEVTGRLLLSSDLHELSVGLIAATGRRPHEILARASFTAVRGKDYLVKFAGQGKKRGETPVFEIATLFPARYIVERLKHLRSDPGMKSLLEEVSREFQSITRQNVEIDKRRNGSLNRVVREYFGGQKNGEVILELRHDDPSQNNKALRAAYAALVTERDCKGSLGAKIIFASRLLGHFQSKSESDRDLVKLGTTVGYLDYVVSKPVAFPTTPKQESTKQVRAFESDYEAVLRLQKEWDLPNQQEVVSRLLEPHEKDAVLRNELLEARGRNTQLEAKVAQLESQIAQLKIQYEESHTMTSQPATFDPEAFKADILSTVTQIIETQLAAYTPQTQSASPTPKSVTQPKPKEDIDWESKSHAEVWETKASGAAAEKIRRSYLAIALYNDTFATGDGDRLAITNQALRALSGVNGLLVGDWIKAHADEIVSHNIKHSMANSKDPSKLETYFNKRHGQEKVDKILQKIRSEFLEGITSRLSAA